MAKEPSLGNEEGSAAMERLLLYFVRLMDEIAEREYVLLLCGGGGGCGDGGGNHDSSGGGGSRKVGSSRVWLTWARFSLLGRIHSLLPRR